MHNSNAQLMAMALSIADRDASNIERGLLREMFIEAEEGTPAASHQRLRRMGFRVGLRIVHEDMGEFEVLGWNHNDRGIYNGVRYPMRLRRMSDGYEDYYSEAGFALPEAA